MKQHHPLTGEKTEKIKNIYAAVLFLILAPFIMEEKLRSYFYLGKFDSLIGYQGKSSEISYLVERALILMNKSNNTDLANFKALASYYKTDEIPSVASGPLEDVLALIISFNTDHESNIVDSVQPTTLEKKLFLISSLLKLRRIDIAESTVKSALSQDDEEGALSFLLACTLLAKGDFEEASSVISELISKYEESAVLLNLSALTLLHEGNYPKSETKLLKALELAKNLQAKDQIEITLKNLISCKRLTGENIGELEK